MSNKKNTNSTRSNSLSASTFIIGSLYKIKTNTGNFEGKLICIDVANNLITLEYTFERKCNFIFINTDSISEIEIVNHLDITTSSNINLTDNVDIINTRLEKAILKRKELASKIGKNVTPLAQSIFDALSIMPCHWDGDSIVVMDAVQIMKPYTPESCILIGANPAQLTRVQTIVAAQRKKKNIQ